MPLVRGRFSLASTNLAGEHDVNPDAFHVREVGETARVAQEVGMSVLDRDGWTAGLPTSGRQWVHPRWGIAIRSGMADTAENKRALGRS